MIFKTQKYILGLYNHRTIQYYRLMNPFLWILKILIETSQCPVTNIYDVLHDKHYVYVDIKLYLLYMYHWQFFTCDINLTVFTFYLLSFSFHSKHVYNERVIMLFINRPLSNRNRAFNLKKTTIRLLKSVSPHCVYKYIHFNCIRGNSNWKRLLFCIKTWLYFIRAL